jgi:hypothetical protein
VGVEHFVLLYVEDAHSRNRFGNAFGAKGAILQEADFNVCVLGFDAGLFLVETSHPSIAVWVTWVEGREE